MGNQFAAQPEYDRPPIRGEVLLRAAVKTAAKKMRQPGDVEPSVVNPKTGIKVHRTVRKVQMQFEDGMFVHGFKVDSVEKDRVNFTVHFPPKYAIESDKFFTTSVLFKTKYSEISIAHGENTGLALVIKLVRVDGDGGGRGQREEGLVRLLSTVPCKQLRARVIGHLRRETSKWEMIAMEPMDGDLFDYVEEHRVSRAEAVSFVQQVQQQIMCIYDAKGLVNRDLKLENILFRRSSVGVLRVVVGDLGSFDNDTTTYVCGRKDDDQECMSFQLGFLFAQLVLRGEKDQDLLGMFHYKARRKRPRRRYNKILKILKERLEEQGYKDEARYIDPDRSRRPSLEELRKHLFPAKKRAKARK